MRRADGPEVVAQGTQGRKEVGPREATLFSAALCLLAPVFAELGVGADEPQRQRDADRHRSTSSSLRTRSRSSCDMRPISKVTTRSEWLCAGLGSGGTGRVGRLSASMAQSVSNAALIWPTPYGSA